MKIMAAALAVSCGGIWGAPTDARAQALIPSAGLAGGCQGSDGSICRRSADSVSGAVALQISDPFIVAFRVSQFDDASAGESSYYSGSPAAEFARVRHERQRTVAYGVEFLYRPRALRMHAVSAFVGGGIGVKTARVDTTCALGDCGAGSSLASLIGRRRSASSYLSFVAGVDVRVAYGIFVRGVLRTENFPSETGTFQLGAELGYVIRFR